MSAVANALGVSRQPDRSAKNVIDVSGASCADLTTLYR